MQKNLLKHVTDKMFLIVYLFAMRGQDYQRSGISLFGPRQRVWQDHSMAEDNRVDVEGRHWGPEKVGWVF
jgi:hypothetical protein